jgi:NADH:ubiquinone oxidoreductase subunit D
MHQKTAPEGAFLQIMPHGVAQVNAAASNNARLVYQPQRAVKIAVFSQISPFGYRVSGIGYRVSGIGYRVSVQAPYYTVTTIRFVSTI